MNNDSFAPPTTNKFKSPTDARKAWAWFAGTLAVIAIVIGLIWLEHVAPQIPVRAIVWSMVGLSFLVQFVENRKKGKDAQAAKEVAGANGQA